MTVKENNNDEIERFWDKIEADNFHDCWIWTGGLYHSGYGMFNPYHHNAMGVHKYSWITHFGDVPKGKLVLHKCNVRRCVNPYHLYLGDHKDNARDAINAGRIVPGHIGNMYHLDKIYSKVW